MQNLISPKLKKQLKQYEATNVTHDLYCERCGHKYDLHEFESGYTVKDGCECENIRQAKETTERRKREHEQRKIDAMFNQSQINPSIKQATVNNYKPTNESQQNAKDIAVEYVKNFSIDNPKSLILHGSIGTGKSHLAFAITKALKNQGYKVAFMHIPKLMNRIKSTYKRDATETVEDIIKQLSGLDFLVLDDVGVDDSAHAISKMEDIVDNRAGLNNIYTTNLTGKQLGKDLNWQRVYSRMQLNGKRLNVVGEDYREGDAW
ncbi:ATP-binding protein [Staphylococcus equorum]|uniref:ATP-binding protein n=1 Tax=Staphylococcus equorum TaxID=246432 RepID=UPI002556CC14|nr:ATP-binding protein [Staphylococcus equorum]MDK9867832.1 ATP-binding protein [Staphylococcus equorum]